MRAVGVFYGCIALIVFGFVLINERRVEQVTDSDVCIPLISSDRKCDLPESAIRAVPPVRRSVNERSVVEIIDSMKRHHESASFRQCRHRTDIKEHR